MSLDANRLKTSIKAALIASGASDIALTDTLAGALATAIVTEVLQATVVPTALVWPGGMAPAPVTGTGTLT